MADIQQRISQLEERLRELKARQQRQEARRQRLEAQRARKFDTRRKILVGAVVLAKVGRGDLAESQLKKWLDDSLKRPHDRSLFGLAAELSRDVYFWTYVSVVCMSGRLPRHAERGFGHSDGRPHALWALVAGL